MAVRIAGELVTTPYNRNPRNQKRGDCIKSLGSQLTLPQTFKEPMKTVVKIQK